MDSKRDRSTSRVPGSGARRLIAGLRITKQDEVLLTIARPYFPETASEGEVAYRLWRRGLELTLAEAAALGAALPRSTSEELIASLVAQRLLLTLPLLRRTGLLALLQLEMPPLSVRGKADFNPSEVVADSEPIDGGASDTIAGLGGSDFL